MQERGCVCAMVNRTRLKTMIRLAEYESGTGRRDLSIHRYYRRDYIAANVIRTFFLTTVGYALLLFLIVAANSEVLFDNISRMDYGVGLFYLLLSYLSVLAVTIVVTVGICWSRYRRAANSVRQYERALDEMERQYRKEKE